MLRGGVAVVWLWIDVWMPLCAAVLVVVVAMARSGAREDLGRASRDDAGDDVED